MKILIHDYAGHPFPIGLSRELARRGHQVLHAYASGLLTPRGSLVRQEDDPDEFEFAQVRMDERYRRDKYSFLKRRRYEIAYGKRLQALIRTWAPNLILSGNTPSEPQWLAIHQANKLGIPFVYWVQDVYSRAVKSLASRRSRILGQLAGYYYERVDRKCFSRCAHTVPITSDFGPLLQTYGVAADEATVIENWGALVEMPMIGKQNDWSKEHGLDGYQVMMYTGTLAMKHNPELLIELARSVACRQDVMVVVVSEGPGADYLKRTEHVDALPNLRVLPFQPFCRMPEALGTADLFLALLETEAGAFSVPSKILTYLCAGKPTLAAMPPENLAGKLLRFNNAGIVVNPGDARAFVDSAVALLANARQRRELGANARRYAETHFDIAHIADKFLTIFEKVMTDANCGRHVIRHGLQLRKAQSS